MIGHLHLDRRDEMAAGVRRGSDPPGAGDTARRVKGMAPSTPAASGSSSGLEASLLAPDSGAWRHALEEVPHDFYHLPEYVRLCGHGEPGRACALRVTDGGAELLLPLILRPVDGGGLDATSPYGYPGPIVAGTDDPAFAGRALAACWRLLRVEGVVSVFVRLHPLLSPVPAGESGTLVWHGETVSIDLALPPREAWAQMRLNHRRDIGRARRLGFSARMDTGFEFLQDFERLYRATMERLAAGPAYLFGDDYFTGLRDALGESLHLCIVEGHGRVAAAGLFVETDGIVEYHLGAWDVAFRDVQPMKLMLDFVRSWGQERRDRVFHLGGGVGGSTDSLFLFKAGFSPARHAFGTLRVVIDRDRYRELARARGAGDPDDATGYFPMYRRP